MEVATKDRQNDEKVAIGIVDDTSKEMKLNYIYKPSQVVYARFDGNNARCGVCNHKLGEFAKADGEILCKNVNRGARCNTKNKIKR